MNCLLIRAIACCTLLPVTPVFAQHALPRIEVPSKVSDGWKKLSKLTRTYRYSQNVEGLAASATPSQMIISRLDATYSKIEELDGDFQANYQDKIIRVIMFDGEEYFGLGRKQLDNPMYIQTVGARGSPLFSSLNVQQSVSSQAFDVDVLNLLNSNDFMSMVFEETADERSILTIVRDVNPAHKPPKIIATLDPSNNYRVVNAIGELGTGVDYRLMEEMQYDQHPAIPSKLTKSHQQLKPSNQ